MVDTGASSNFISLDLVKQFNLDIENCAPGEEMFFRLANNTVYTSRSTTTITLRLDNTMHGETITLRVIDGASFSIILCMPWLRRHNPTLHFDTMTIEMHCLHKGRCFPVRRDDEEDEMTLSSQAASGSSTTQTSPNSTLPTFISIEEPVTTEETIASNITQPFDEAASVDNSPLPHYQEFLLAPVLDQWWLENYNTLVFPQENDTQLFNETFHAWNYSTFDNEPTGGWLQPITQESTINDLNNNEDALSFYGLAHPAETVAPFNTGFIDSITPPASVHEDDEDEDSVIDVTYDHLVRVARGPPPENPEFDSWNYILEDVESDTNFIDANSINNTILDNYSSCFPFATCCSIFDNSVLSSFLRMFTYKKISAYDDDLLNPCLLHKSDSISSLSTNCNTTRSINLHDNTQSPVSHTFCCLSESNLSGSPESSTLPLSVSPILHERDFINDAFKGGRRKN
ncbi:hypothetical protein [Parasitella parasitica]|uniref:Uncharacterized protein n=1 Tax=Parasitella parasitica TaxID=35722 RepID=A0A0B7NBN9_9FUNG|nr:hypothetical protein [Parasitella parasitica]